MSHEIRLGLGKAQRAFGWDEGFGLDASLYDCQRLHAYPRKRSNETPCVYLFSKGKWVIGSAEVIPERCWKNMVQAASTMLHL